MAQFDPKDSLTWVKAMARGEALPLDASSIWYSYSDAASYAQGSAIAYPGQVITVVEENLVSTYVIDQEKNLIKLYDETNLNIESISNADITKAFSDVFGV